MVCITFNKEKQSNNQCDHPFYIIIHYSGRFLIQFWRMPFLQWSPDQPSICKLKMLILTHSILISTTPILIWSSQLILTLHGDYANLTDNGDHYQDITACILVWVTLNLNILMTLWFPFKQRTRLGWNPLVMSLLYSFKVITLHKISRS